MSTTGFIPAAGICWTQAHRHSARRVLMTMADPVARVNSINLDAVQAGGDPCRAAVSTAQANRRMSAFGYQAEVLCSV